MGAIDAGGGFTRVALTTSLAAVVAAVSLAMPVAAADRDHDGLRDAWEAKYGVTSPNLKDSDWDGVIDSAEDNDNDRLGNLGEQRFGTDPGVRDTDGDGVPDGAEDHDRDGRLNAAEQDQRPVPGGLVPSLSRASRDFGQVVKGCDTKQRSSALTRCYLRTDRHRPPHRAHGRLARDDAGRPLPACCGERPVPNGDHAQGRLHAHPRHHEPGPVANRQGDRPVASGASTRSSTSTPIRPTSWSSSAARTTSWSRATATPSPRVGDPRSGE